MDQNYLNDADENLKFIRCAKFMFDMMQKYSDAYTNDSCSTSDSSPDSDKAAVQK
ncbi:hypothetical protein [Butyricicoccus intestinisimiae]|uniref:Uncharacterized protein n=1 Tax=Butyricicoccus intestinisimiae TaxID=2841509 RepID=A0ABS6ERW2_9FIRM|nr:hypothetical protein [Butyricicoccus intestinisimiae]MBU5489595.1 hypothetical protein [Butyricicoccus intestinisimiae]